jgi:hypothetical protein
MAECKGPGRGRPIAGKRTPAIRSITNGLPDLDEVRGAFGDYQLVSLMNSPSAVYVVRGVNVAGITLVFRAKDGATAAQALPGDVVWGWRSKTFKLLLPKFVVWCTIQPSHGGRSTM